MLGMSPRRYRREHTRRDHLDWLAWMDAQWGKPSRSDYYAMQTAALLAKGKSVEDMKLKFEAGRKREPTSAKSAARLAKTVWAMRLGVQLREEDL